MNETIIKMKPFNLVPIVLSIWRKLNYGVNRIYINLLQAGRVVNFEQTNFEFQWKSLNVIDG